MPRDEVFREIANLGAVEAVVKFESTEGEVAIRRAWFRLIEGDSDGQDAPGHLAVALAEPIHQQWGWEGTETCAEGSITWTVKDEQVLFAGREKRWEDVDEESL